MVSQQAVEDALVAMSPSEFYCFAQLAEPAGIQGMLLSGSGIDYGSTLLSEPDVDAVSYTHLTLPTTPYV